MTDDGYDTGLEDWFPDFREDPDVERFKWGWSRTEGTVVWEVGGPGDGRPGHAEHLQAVWGREPSKAAGAVIGGGEYTPARGAADPTVAIHVYYGGQVPDAVVDWFRRTFPTAQLRRVRLASSPSSG